MRNQYIKKLFTIAIVLLPILSIYISPINGMDLGTFILLILLPFLFISLIVKKEKKINIPIPMLLLILYTFIGSFFAYIFSNPDDFTLALLRLFKFIIILIIVFVIGKDINFDYFFAKKILKIVTIISVSYIIIQSVSWYTMGRLLPSVPFNIIQGGGSDPGSFEYIAESTMLYRPSSFFLEPASFSQYILLYLAFCLFGDHKEKGKDYVVAIYITIGLLLSTSGQGILLGLLLWVFWLFDQLSKSNIGKKLFLIMFLAPLFIVGVSLIYQTQIVHGAISRVFTSISGSPSLVISLRVFTYSYFDQLQWFQKIIGSGYGNVPTGIYFNSIAYTLYCSGFIGLIFVVILFFNTFIHTSHFQKVFCFIYALIIIGSATLTATSIAFYFMFIYSGYKKDDEFKNVTERVKII